jgi:transcriptional regulator with XRE-family HTH domain
VRTSVTPSPSTPGALPWTEGEMAFISRTGQWVKAIRTARKMTQDEICQAVKMGRRNFGDFEQGDRSMTLINLYRVARHLRVPVAALFHDTAPDPVEVERIITLADRSASR